MEGSPAGRIVVCADAHALAHQAAEWFAATVEQSRGVFRLALSGGSTPVELCRLLATDPWRTELPWPRMQVFWGDERFVAHDDPQSNFRMARETLLSRVTIPDANIHPVPFEGTPDDAAASYETTLQALYGGTELDPSRPLFDLTLLGLGNDGHTASLLPGEPVLAERSRWVAAVAHGRPEPRITLTYPALESSRTIAFLVTGKDKAAAVRRARAGDATIPAGRLRPRGETVWFLDPDAAGETP